MAPPAPPALALLVLAVCSAAAAAHATTAPASGLASFPRALLAASLPQSCKAAVPGCATCATRKRCKTCDPALNVVGATCKKCKAGYKRCGLSSSPGCETNTDSDMSNCGACGRHCKGDEVCLKGQCSTKPQSPDGGGGGGGGGSAAVSIQLGPFSSCGEDGAPLAAAAPCAADGGGGGSAAPAVPAIAVNISQALFNSMAVYPGQGGFYLRVSTCGQKQQQAEAGRPVVLPVEAATQLSWAGGASAADSCPFAASCPPPNCGDGSGHAQLLVTNRGEGGEVVYVTSPSGGCLRNVFVSLRVIPFCALNPDLPGGGV